MYQFLDLALRLHYKDALDLTQIIVDYLTRCRHIEEHYMSRFDSFNFNQTLPIINEDTEFFPLMTQQDEDEMRDAEIPDQLPVLPLRNTVLFPGVVIPITVGRDKSIKLVKDAYKGDRTIAVVSQKDMTVEDPT